ncbi:hypothetical protein [Paenibacillus sp. MDMC362]|nr:hypothetical protein [Paenibacillus sp. MDMC362]
MMNGAHAGPTPTQLRFLTIKVNGEWKISHFITAGFRSQAGFCGW